MGCIPTKAWVQTAHACTRRGELFAKLGVKVGEPELDFPAANEWKDPGRLKQMTGGVASLFKANGVQWVKGAGKFSDANTIAVEGGEDVASSRRSSPPAGPAPPAHRGPRFAGASTRRGLARRRRPGGFVILGGGIIGGEFALDLQHASAAR